MPRTVQEKYDELLQMMGLFFFHPYQAEFNYYSTFASFGDSIPQDIIDDIEKEFKSSEQYNTLLNIKQEMGIK